MQPLGYKVKFPMNVFTHCELGEGWVHLVKREQGFRWIKCPPEPAKERMEVKMVDFFWHLLHPVFSEGGGKAVYRRI